LSKNRSAEWVGRERVRTEIYAYTLPYTSAGKPEAALRGRAGDMTVACAEDTEGKSGRNVDVGEGETSPGDAHSPDAVNVPVEHSVTEVGMILEPGEGLVDDAEIQARVVVNKLKSRTCAEEVEEQKQQAETEEAEKPKGAVPTFRGRWAWCPVVFHGPGVAGKRVASAGGSVIGGRGRFDLEEVEVEVGGFWLHAFEGFQLFRRQLFLDLCNQVADDICGSGDGFEPDTLEFPDSPVK